MLTLGRSVRRRRIGLVRLILLGGHLADRGAPVALARRLSLVLAVAVAVLATAAVLLLAQGLRRGLPPCQHEL